MLDILNEIIETASTFNLWDIAGLVFGLLTVIFLIKESIWTWPFGILYVLVSLIVFYRIALWGDWVLHIFYFILNIYGWYYWLYGKKKSEKEVPITTMTKKASLMTLVFAAFGILILGFSLEHINYIIPSIKPAALPYWDATTSILSIVGMWLTAKKKIENWYYWFIVDVLATGIYFYKEIYFYGVLYLIYIGLAVKGYINWKKLMEAQ